MANESRNAGQAVGMNPLPVIEERKKQRHQRHERKKMEQPKKTTAKTGRKKMTGKERAAAAAQGAESTSVKVGTIPPQPAVRPTTQAEAEKAEAIERLYDDGPNEPTEPKFEMPEWAVHVLTQVADCNGKLVDEVVEHRHQLKDIDVRLQDVEEKLGIIDRSEYSVSSAKTEPLEAVTASEPAEPELKVDADAPEPAEPEQKVDADASEPAEPELKAEEPVGSIGYTGKQWVFFIHDENGDLDYDHPFYSCLAARHYDRLYEAVPALVVGGVFKRALQPGEVTRDFL